VASYLEILQAGHILTALGPFAGGRRSELTRAQKLFFIDNGIRHHLVGDLRGLEDRPDSGKALENWVFGELWKELPADADLRFWRSTSKAEVDFVVSARASIIGVEVKAAHLDRARISRSARSFIQAYEPKAFIVVNRGITASEQLGPTEIRWMSPPEIAPGLADILG
jgi:predicted AAA+ superfamily ATPase